MSVATNSSTSSCLGMVKFQAYQAIVVINSGVCTEKFQGMNVLSTGLFTI